MKSFKLYNVKSFVETNEIELRPITIVVGRNSCGKSSLIRFPVVLSQTFKEEVYTPILFFGNLIDYGSFDDVVHNHSENNIGFELTFDKKKLRMFRSINGRYLTNGDDGKECSDFFKYLEKASVKIVIKKYKKRIIVENIELLVNDNVIADINRKNNKYNFNFKYIFNDNKLNEFNDDLELYPNITFNKFIPNIEFTNEDFIKQSIEKIFDIYSYNKIDKELIEKYIKLSLQYSYNNDMGEVSYDNFTDEEKKFILLVKNIFKNMILISSLFKTIDRALNIYSNKVTYIGPFRKNPDRIYRDSENYYDSVGKAGENATLLLRQAQQSNSKLLEGVSMWFNKSMGYEIDIEEISNSNLFKLIVKGKSNTTWDNIIDVGYGISQVLPIVTQLYHEDSMKDERRRYFNTQKKETFIIEQPELHLHPSAQASLADLFVEKVLQKDEYRLLVETHSEHLIRRLQVLVADPEVNITPDDIAIYYVDKSNDNSSSITKMNICPNGQFDKLWPTGFFDKSYELSKELLKVSRKKVQK
ncbi:DUF3696 domain-containing protein [Clostridium botulinum]|uniref:DUF3696 domain-containing protein n=1 Tax=Clostridium botulinum TaxID=1491 RepID=UPI000773C834|nr:DUF3696 domain-containing protein [Clostridium botulinum]NFE95943.1 DUF3696 domain-containing protein [Clostridium botulinum]NFL39426.1 DUF3696 domain-containing protein [Clostridium botulinum]NFL65065.1 DUF3696 domain-containing protein [Clostridium botulinum]NFN09285.1 DUF3696 domain-containing protein [Clostridium botulinum]NFN25893.1 DUF3696 domain-containing protein [Clostridium botulinum]